MNLSDIQHSNAGIYKIVDHLEHYAPEMKTNLPPPQTIFNKKIVK